MRFASVRPRKVTLLFLASASMRETRTRLTLSEGAACVVSATIAGDAASSLLSGGVTNRPDTSHTNISEAITDADMKFFDITQPYTPREHTPLRERANNSSPPQRKKKIRGCYGTKPLLDRFVTKIPIDGTLSLPLSDKARLLALPHQIGTLHYLSRPLAAA
jgi:hypothetical protein